MGLDSVELILAFEEEFGVDIPNEDAEQMVTVGDVYEWLKIRLASADPIACLTQRIFYKLRRALVENYSLQRRSITPDTRLTDLLTLDEVKEGWPFLQMFIDLRTPKFKVANEILGFRLTDDTLKMRELVDSLIAINREALSPQRESEAEIWNRLVRVVVRQINARPEEVKPEARFTRDLGVD
jgi:acyl carrier protein